jgi:hypothetical protein
LGGALHLEGVFDKLIGLPAAGDQQRDRERRERHQTEAHGHDDPGILHKAAGF